VWPSRENKRESRRNFTIIYTCKRKPILVNTSISIRSSVVWKIVVCSYSVRDDVVTTVIRSTVDSLDRFSSVVPLRENWMKYDGFITKSLKTIIHVVRYRATFFNYWRSTSTRNNVERYFFYLATNFRRVFISADIYINRRQVVDIYIYIYNALLLTTLIV